MASAGKRYAEADVLRSARQRDGARAGLDEVRGWRPNQSCAHGKLDNMRYPTLHSGSVR
jgi:hypothetical protein